MDKLTIKNLSKRYKDFTIENVSFSIPEGSVVGLIGENGAGKSTLIKSILGIIRPQCGQILFDGKDLALMPEAERQKIAYVLDDTGLPEELTLSMQGQVFAKIFRTWKEDTYKALLKKLELPTDKALKAFSKGMKMKAAIAVALSYDSELLLLDEPTSGLDPVVRDEILGMLYDYNQSGERAILISSHITADLEKLCDYIVYLHDGKVVFKEEKDELLQKYAIYGVEERQLFELEKGAAVRYLRREYGLDILALREKMPESFVSRPASLEEIMLFYAKGEEICSDYC